MYIFDCLYGNITFDKKMYRCMISPEMQRLREVRLGNINSLFLTGSANINRFEHCVGTAYLASRNIAANKSTFNMKYKNVFLYASLFHDLANGPFGHSYEYIQEKQGFNPEKNIGDVIFGTQTGVYKKRATLEPFYLGQQNQIPSILSQQEVEEVDCIVRGDNKYCSKILSSDIDIDNIDNVYRMAYHMGIHIDKKIPVALAEGIVCIENKIYFKDSVIPYLYDWYETRRKVYELLLFNPQDFAAKCMLSEVMDLTLEKNASKIKWSYTDGELIDAFLKINDEYWEDEFVLISDKAGMKKEDFMSEDRIKKVMEEMDIEIPSKANITIEDIGEYISFKYYNTEYRFKSGKLYKKTRRVLINPNKLTTRLMRGDLYSCIGIYVSEDIDKYDLFSDGAERRRLESECNYYIEKELGTKEYAISFHGIIDKNKTNRRLEVFLTTGEHIQVGKSTNNLLVGAFAKGAGQGLNGKGISANKSNTISDVVQTYLCEIGIKSKKHKLYSEVDQIV